MGNLYRLLLLSLLLLSYKSTIAQSHKPPAINCDVPELTDAQRNILEQKASFALRVKMATNAAFTAITYIPIRPHILQKSDGTGGMSLSSINQVMAITNSYYLLNGFGIQFYFAGTVPDTINNTNQYNSFNNESLVTSGHDVNSALNQYYVNNFASGVGGYAYYPDDAVYSTRSFILNEYWSLDDMGNRLVPHELGHNFNLVHTFGNNNGSGGSTELVTRGAGANCSTNGDLVCDTPADPYNKLGANVINDSNNCPFYDPASTARDANNQPYSPSISNIMSYYFPCTHDFTPGQYDRMQAGLALRQSHSSYTLNYPPTTVAAPTNVVASIVNNQIVITWQDNGTNEMGYFIERSISPASGFMLIGGVGPNETLFTDTKTASLTTYYYRVKPSNSTTTGISAMASIKTPACHPSYTNNCTDNDGLAGFVINSVALSQNSGCSLGGYSSTTAISATVSAGQSYSFTGTLLSTTYTEGITIWVDLNRNNLFETGLGERLYQSSSLVAGQFSGTLALPASLTVGPISMRIVVAYNAIPNDPCGAYPYGETEDYILNIGPPPPADLSLSLQTSTRASAINQPVSYSLTMRNDGPSNATGVQWQNRLPAGLTFSSGGVGVTGSSTAVSGPASISLASGQAITFTYQLTPTQPGVYINAAQIISSDQSDPDSQPGSGTGDGQDDEASVDIRTNPDNGTVYSSPNPNQVPLPFVLPNQPTPDPAKADLSLAMAINNRTPRIGQPITITISVGNKGGLAASNILVRDTLRGLTFTSSPTGMSIVSTTASYTIVEGTVASLTAGASTQLILVATPISTGYKQNAAQIWSVATPDPDSTPGSLTPTANNLNGEDDVAWIDLRVDS